MGLAPHSLPLPMNVDPVLPRRWEDELTRVSRQYRNSRTGNARRAISQPDHDVFEGLPVRRWHRKQINVNAAPDKPDPNTTSILQSGYAELPMPKDAIMLPDHTYALLRAARMGLSRRDPSESLETDKENKVDEEIHTEEKPVLLANKWALVSREEEGPEPEYLAKRRKGLPSVYGGLTIPPATTSPMRKTKIRKVDSDGTNRVWEVLVPEGQSIDGEIGEEEVSPVQVPMPGTLVEGLGVTNAEGVVIAKDSAITPAVKKKVHPPKRRLKSLHRRSKKKKVAFAPGSTTTNTVTEGMQANDVAIHSGNDQAINNGHLSTNGEISHVGDTTMQDVGADLEEGSEEGSEIDEPEEGEGEEEDASSTPEALHTEASASPSQVQNPELPSIEPSDDVGVQDQDEIDPRLALSPSARSPEVEVKPEEELAPHQVDNDGDTSMIASHTPLVSTDESCLMTQSKLARSPDRGPAALSPHPARMQEDIDGGDFDPPPDPIPSAPPLGSMQEEILLDPHRQNSFQQPDVPTATNFDPEITDDQVDRDEVSRGQSPDTKELVSLSANVDESKRESLRETQDQHALSMVTDDAEASHETPSRLSLSPKDSSNNAIEEPSREAVKLTPSALQDAPMGTLPLDSAFPQLPPPDLPTSNIPSPAASPAEIPRSEALPMEVSISEEQTVVATDPIAQPERSPPLYDEPPLNFATPTLPGLQTTALFESHDMSQPAPADHHTPKAPTPSPPTPLSASFGPQTQSMNSPQAPTMSPPTPAREPSSSPDLPLASRSHHQLPNVTLDSSVPPLPGLGPPLLSPDSRIDVEAAPDAPETFQAEIPHEHNPLDGLVAPTIPESAEQQQQQQQSEVDVVRFEDGEENLLGGHERDHH